MDINLEKATIEDANEIHQMQLKSFKELLDKYQDYEISPGNEPIDKIIARINQKETDYYIIKYNNISVGAIRIINLDDGKLNRISPIFILPEFQNKEIAQSVFKIIEEKYKPQNGWILDTILQEKGNCYLYEKMGYVRTGKIEKINEKMDIVYYEKNMKILYVTDLDGTLLKSNDKMSEYTIRTINKLIDNGMCFSYATARSLSSASIVTNGLTTNIPVIIHNGTFIINAHTKERLFSLYFTEEEKSTVINILNKYLIYPLVYGFINDEEKVSWIKYKENDGIKRYINLRKGDKRLRPIGTKEELYYGKLFYFTCIGERKELIDIYNYSKDSDEFTCTLQQELYREEYWFEIMPKKATKGNAILTLKEKLKCNKIISFGDSVNDIPMFEISDESYAVENAVDELKKHATGIIMSNEKDGVAHWLEENYKRI